MMDLNYCCGIGAAFECFLLYQSLWCPHSRCSFTFMPDQPSVCLLNARPSYEALYSRDRDPNELKALTKFQSSPLLPLALFISETLFNEGRIISTSIGLRHITHHLIDSRGPKVPTHETGGR